MRRVIAAKRPAWIALVIALVFHTLLLSVQTNRRIDTRFVRVWLLDSLGPVEKLVDLSVHSVGNIWSGYIGLIGTHRENLRLQSENGQLQMELARKSEEVLELA